MSSEQFDKRIKGKLEEVKPPYSEQAWKNFQQMLPAPWYVALFKTYSSWLYSSIGTVAIIATFYLYYQQKQENNLLHEKITTLQSQVTQLEKSSSLPPARVSMDTIPDIRPVSPDRAALQEIPEDPVNQKTKHKVASENITDNLNGVTPAERSVSPAGKVDSTTTQSNTLTNKIAPEKKQDPTTRGATSNTITPTITPTLPDSNQAPNQNPATITKQETSIPNSTLPGPDQAAPDSTADSTNVASIVQPESKEKATNQLSTFQIRLGLQSDLNGFNKAAGGPALEVLFGKRLSVNTGVLFSTPEEKRLPFPRDYNMATGRRFEDDYRKHIPHNDRLQGIIVKTSIVKMPLGVNYYLPLKGNLSLMAIAGTKLNVSVYQTVEFRSFFGGEEQLNKFETKYKTNLFNNLYYGLGLQYKFGRFVGQLNPYYNMYFREPDYFNQSKKLGVNAALKFDLKK